MTNKKGEKLAILRNSDRRSWRFILKESGSFYTESTAPTRADAMLELAYQETVYFSKQDCWSILKETVSLALFNFLWRRYAQRLRDEPGSVPTEAVGLLAHLHRMALEEVKKSDSRFRLYGLRGGVKL